MGKPSKNKKYLRSLQAWETEQLLLINQMKLNLQYLKDDISLKKKQIAIIEKSIIHEEKAIDRNSELMEKYR